MVHSDTIAREFITTCVLSGHVHMLTYDVQPRYKETTQHVQRKFCILFENVRIDVLASRWEAC